MTTRLKQKGVFLIEALMGILIFSLGILTLVAIQTAAISAQSGAQYRIEAANLANQMLSQIWLGIDRTNAATVQSSLAAFQHQPNGSSCHFSGTASMNADVTSWVSTATSGTTALPGATATMQQILVNTGNYNSVTLTLCWKAPLDAGPRKHTVSTYVN
jgi:type IV pilus modification protein PilV